MVLPVDGGEGTEVGAIPRVVQGVASVSRIAADLKFVIILFAVQLERGILGIPEDKEEVCVLGGRLDKGRRGINGNTGAWFNTTETL